MYRQIKRNNPKVHFHNCVLMPSPTAWLAVLEREEGGRGGREINTSVETALAGLFFYGAEEERRGTVRETVWPLWLQYTL